MTRSDTKKHTAFIRRLFGSIATRYDLLNRLISFGQDQAWRRYAAAQWQLPRGGWLLDVATGTGDMTLQARRRYPEATFIGIDLTPGMLRQAREKSLAAIGEPLRLLRGDALDLPFPDDRFDAAISGFMMRNVADVARAVAEQRRVVRPGGQVVCLEITRPQVWPVRWFFWLYFYGLVPLLGGLLSGQPGAYAYLPRSVARFLTADELQAVMEAVGLQEVRYHLLALGTVAVHVGVK
ncbi:MAG: ubiquinone/menaquinone biosynthesis methyltransferase [Chloroflexi bacterium]|nr:ubiquinone/menaquinone biosynthesis methyltransferase [Chloroflexota bacterium]